MKSTKLTSFFSALIIGSWIVVIIFLSYWSLYPYKVMDFKVSPYPIINENQTVKRGERLIYQVDACKYMPITPELTKFFIDGVIYETPKSIGAVEMGCHVQNIDVYVPKAIPAGHYKMKFVARYKVNPIRTIEYVNYSEPFTVIN